MFSKRSTRQVPGYLETQDAFKAAGIDEVMVYCVNDAAVMKVQYAVGWNELLAGMFFSFQELTILS
jgi:peroxiredoxin